VKRLAEPVAAGEIELFGESMGSLFRPAKGKPRTVHVHACPTGSEWERAHLVFRDYLRVHPHRAAVYGAVKSELAERHREDGLEYTDAKGPFIEEQLQCAEEWAAQTGWSAG